MEYAQSGFLVVDEALAEPHYPYGVVLRIKEAWYLYIKMHIIFLLMALAFYVVYVGWPKSIAKGKKQAATKALEIIENNLKATDFKWNKRIVLADFKIDPSMLGLDGFIFDLSSGIWIDYELLEGTKIVHSGLAVGYGLIAIGGGIVNLSDGLSIRIVTGGMRGAKAILLHLIIPRGGLLNSRVGSKINQNSSDYQSCLECARAMIDELGNIMRLVKT
jgi:hypothetical protein